MKTRNILISAVVIVMLISMVILSACSFKPASMYEQVTTKYKKGQTGFEQGWSNHNNGYAKDGKIVDQLLSQTADERKVIHSDNDYYNFVHFGMNTMTDKEWGDGSEKVEDFNATNADTDQWVKVLKDSGSDGVIFTAKHHDGFCLWDTETTDFNVMNSPYGQDIVRKFARSCKQANFKFGIYLSPWDIHEPRYGIVGGINDEGSYNYVFYNQIKEVLNIVKEEGVELFEFWFDGARGQEVSPDFQYAWDDIYKLINTEFPDCAIGNCGNDVRWVGNEAGNTRKSEWSVIINGKPDQQQMSEADAKRLGASYEAEDRGSRDTIEEWIKAAGTEQLKLRYFPAESDVRIRSKWFWHKNDKTKSAEELARLYFTNAGWNSFFLLNVAPNDKGVIEQVDIDALMGMKKIIDESLANPISIKNVTVSGYVNGQEKVLDATSEPMAITKDTIFDRNNRENPYAYYKMPDDGYIMDFYFNNAQTVRRIDLREDMRYSQRVEAFEVWAKVNGKWQIIGDNTIIGNRKIFLFKKPVTTDQVRIVIKQSRSNPYLRSVCFYAGN